MPKILQPWHNHSGRKTGRQDNLHKLIHNNTLLDLNMSKCDKLTSVNLNTASFSQLFVAHN